ncbi:stress responsive A/B barrel domain protein [Penicillium daleae]|uniref:Stress responsive A/B barrel domain protein n=1 Tax=Penicillium daleae TaxID=63821 RepID=A0AAD6CEU9_9EURO|nr:stress responsive A/B barrel domain protein [Penicillium daleae]KAJ5461911.1 stress responsive A/B barrel domain protein [Penicillium daleae]
MTTHIISRVTVFKIPKLEDQEVVLREFTNLQHGALKDGVPYILSVKAGHCFEDTRSQGCSIALQTTFSGLEDMQFFDHECRYHEEMKKIVGPRITSPPLVVYFKDIVASTTA